MTPVAPPPAYPEEFARLAVRASVVAGPPGPEKSALMGRLCAWFEGQGLRATVLVRQEAPDLGDEGKDTRRFRLAGASLVALAGPGELQLTLTETEPLDPPLSPLFQALAFLAPHADVVLVDGPEAGGLPCILLVGEEAEATVPAAPEILAVVSDLDIAGEQPRFRPGQVAEMGEFLKSSLGFP